MKLSRPVSLLLALIAAVPATAQTKAKLKSELRKQERAAKKDPDALYEAGKWAMEQELEKDATRIFKKVLKYDADHAGANTALGNELVEGKWLPAKEAKKLREKALEAEFAAKGFQKIDDVWVSPEHVEDARKGFFHHDGEIVSRAEKMLLQAGHIRHPRTGQLVPARFKDKVDSGYFPIGDGEWGDLEAADKFHGKMSRPWVVRTHNATLITTLPLEKIEELKTVSDQGYEKVAPLFGGRRPPPAKRPVVIVAKTSGEYNQYGQALGDGTDVAGAFLISPEAEFTLSGQGQVRPAICVNDKNWGPRYVRHATALAYVNAIAEASGADLPLWFVHGVGSMTSRFENDSDAGWFGKQHVAKGGVSGDLGSFFDRFQLSADIETKQVDFNLFQAGLMISFATRGGNQEITDAMVQVTDALSGKAGSAAKAVTKLEKALAGARQQIVEHLNQLIAKAPG